MTDKRQEQFIRRVEMWKKRLVALGLSNYRVDGVELSDAPGGNEGSSACVHASTNYDSAHFSFKNSMVDDAYNSGNFEYLDQCIIHEWVHVAFQDYYNSIFLVGDKLAPDVSAVWEEAMEHANERLIDRLARQLHGAFLADVVR